MPQSSPIHFSPNVPQILSLSDPAGTPNGFNVEYPTTDGRVLSLPRAVAIRLNALDVKCGESFGICKRVPQLGVNIPLHRTIFEWDLWLTPETEQARAAKEQEVMPTGPLIEADATRTSGTVAQGRVRTRKLKAMPAPALHSAADDTAALPPTGTEGPAPRLATMKRTRVGQIPYNVAFREVCQFVTKGLQEAGEQWSDQARQDAVSTILIAASKQGLLTVWER
jgi:hypothetical protein